MPSTEAAQGADNVTNPHHSEQAFKHCVVDTKKRNYLCERTRGNWNEHGTIFSRKHNNKMQHKNQKTLTPNDKLKGEPRSGESSERSERL